MFFCWAARLRRSPRRQKRRSFGRHPSLSMISTRCECGETFQADERHAGKQIRCRCGRVLTIPVPSTPAPSLRRESRPSSRPASASPVAAPSPIAPRTRRAIIGLALGFAACLIPVLAWWVTRPAKRILDSSALPRATSLALAPSTPIPAATPLPAATPGPDATSSACSPGALYRPRSGEELGAGHRSGLSRLRVVNGTGHDAVVVLIDPSGKPRRAIFIRSGESGPITQIPAGTYRLRFQLGSSWRRARGFCEPIGTSEFDRPLEFARREPSAGTASTTFELTLDPLPQGTGTTHAIPDADFLLPPRF